MERRVLKGDELTAAAESLKDWRVDGSVLRKRLKFGNFAEALAFVDQIGKLAETADHHPDISFGWGYVEIALTTHDRGGITDVDLDLARKVDRIE